MPQGVCLVKYLCCLRSIVNHKITLLFASEPRVSNVSQLQVVDITDGRASGSSPYTPYRLNLSINHIFLLPALYGLSDTSFYLLWLIVLKADSDLSSFYSAKCAF